MQKQLLLDYYKKRGFPVKDGLDAVEYVKALKQPDTLTIEEIRKHLDELIAQNENTTSRLLALARYYYLIGRHDVYIYFTSILGGIGVMESIEQRLKENVGERLSKELMESLNPPPLGADIADYPEFTYNFVSKLESNLSLETCHTVLAGNNHQIPAEAYFAEKGLYEESFSLDDYLKAYNQRQIAILQKHADDGTVWFEQKITQEVVDFVSLNQEIMSAVHDGDWLYTTKIPYDPDRWLKTSDPLEKRYLACHCPFVREAIRTNSHSFSNLWCSCSAGFAKYPYEVIFDRPLKVETLASVLNGDSICRFRIYIGKTV